MRVLVKYHEDYGRSGSLEALFVVLEDVYHNIVGMNSFWLHDVLGKHSEVEVNPSLCKILVKESPEIKEAFDVLEEYVFTGIAGVFLDRVSNPDYYD